MFGTIITMSRQDDLKRIIVERVIDRAENGARIVSSSGTRLSWIYDFKSVILSPDWLDAYAELFWQRFAGRYPFQVGGLETAGIPLVAAIVMKGVARGTPVNGFYIRKSRKRDGLLKFIEGTLDEHPIVLVDDIINSGQTLRKQIEVLHAVGKDISHFFAIIAFRSAAAYAFATECGVAVSNLFTLTDFDMPLEPSQAPEVPANSYDILWRFASPDPSFEHVVEKSAPLIDEHRLYFGQRRRYAVGIRSNRWFGRMALRYRKKRERHQRHIFHAGSLQQHDLLRCIQWQRVRTGCEEWCKALGIFQRRLGRIVARACA